MEKKLEVKNLRISFKTANGKVQAVRNINFELNKGETLAIVGESGSGKSVTSKAILGILSGNSIIEGGEIIYDGKDLLKIEEDEMYRIRGDKIAMIFQDPMSSLNPIVKIGQQITEAMLLKNKASRREAKVEFNNNYDAYVAPPVEPETEEWTIIHNYYLDGTELDLDEVVTTTFILAMDTKNLCSEDCKGLCSRCGADLNDGPCSCKPDVDPRLAALAQLLDDKAE